MPMSAALSNPHHHMSTWVVNERRLCAYLRRRDAMRGRAEQRHVVALIAERQHVFGQPQPQALAQGWASATQDRKTTA